MIRFNFFSSLPTLMAASAFVFTIAVDDVGAQTTSVPVIADTAVETGGIGDEVGTAQSAELEAAGDLARGVGKGQYYKSLSAEHFQGAIDKSLDNRRESVETYFELRDLNDRERESDGFKVDSERAKLYAEKGAPKRLTEKEFDPQTGQIRWVGPLAANALEVYRRPIEESFKRRSSAGEQYGQFDFFRVERMVGLMTEALDSVKDKLAAQEAASLKQYLERISYEARFDSAGKRIDY